MSKTLNSLNTDFSSMERERLIKGYPLEQVTVVADKVKKGAPSPVGSDSSSSKNKTSYNSLQKLQAIILFLVLAVLFGLLFSFLGRSFSKKKTDKRRK